MVRDLNSEMRSTKNVYTWNIRKQQWYINKIQIKRFGIAIASDPHNAHIMNIQKLTLSIRVVYLTLNFWGSSCWLLITKSNVGFADVAGDASAI